MSAGSPLHSIEPYLRDEASPVALRIVVRAGPITIEKFVEHMRRGQEHSTYRGYPMEQGHHAPRPLVLARDHRGIFGGFDGIGDAELGIEDQK